MSENQNIRTAGEAGWHVSKYNIYARIPDSQKFVVLNLIRGICEAYSFVELCLLNDAETLPENHPILERFKKSGFIANYDELEALKAMGRLASRGGNSVLLTICPTMNCNFACTYCFERHRPGIMTEQVQADVAVLAEKMIDASSAKELSVTWFGGEPLLAMNVITALTEKLRTLRIPFRVNVRHNVHKENTDQIPALRALTQKLAEESGNKLIYYPAPVGYNTVSAENGSDLGLLCDDDDDNVEIGLERDINNFRAGGCPVQKVRYGRRRCVAFKNNPEKYALALYENAKKNKAANHDADR